MKLIGIMNNEDFYPAQGTYKGIPYRIVEEGERLLLERVRILKGVGMMASPVEFFDSRWEAIYEI